MKAPPMQRTYSDPDLPQLIPLANRPSSSYEPRPKVKEASQFTKEIMKTMAEKLGINFETHPEFNWVIRDCLLALRDEGWTCSVRNGDLEYVYKHKDQTRPYHPIAAAHQQLAERLTHAQEELKKKHLDPYFRVRHNVYLAIMGEKDVRRVCTPQLCEDVMKDLDVSASDEPYLIRRVKTSIEDAYFRYKRSGRFQTTIETCIDVETLVVNLELDRVGFMKKISPSGLLYCVECQTALGDVISAGCHDVLCNQCAVETHSTGNRQDSPLVFIEQAVCAECTTKAALVRCQDCVELFCYDCFRQTHSAGKRRRHCVGLPQRTFCFECDSREASYICMQCEDALCSRCSANIHRAGSRQNHTLFGLRKAAYSKRLFADNLDRLMGILQRNVERSYALSPWYIFYNQALSPSWYNFISHHMVLADPNNLASPPLEEDDEGEAIPINADEQVLRGLPGATILKDTHVAQLTAQGACFDVPPSQHVKFRT
eukprot:CAMPEP_0197651824 /NCGR_PEP_ID=MMETSP1338-20131121/34071_1 /TAXON_ID=43686 ORGANISM="Pelagodinium beii, Strain RCC1491" /NCGR_SAMPLE_ID=MMETSP1338 /ASSEMBLY_ACC=CAM_ASM_000754 /LENGTH=484 /DNA_ID=CAMNT_0043226565 /DNA_START=78 /DNA_END=1532 /DNA_ORIENTATION=-